MDRINEPTPDIAAQLDRWQKNRDFVGGSDAVKARRELYLPKMRVDDSPREYEAHLARTNLYPAVAKISQGISGLIGRKRSHLASTSAKVQTLAQLITPDYQSLDRFAAWVVRETQVTDFTGILADQPDRSKFAGLSAANELERGFRPYLSGYIGESILEVTPGIRGGRVQLVHVRLLEDGGATVRQLLIDDAGEYVVIVWRRGEGGDFTVASQTKPTVRNQPLREIPFVLVNTQDSLTPTPSLLEPAIDINHQHYMLSGTLAGVIQLTSAPISVITGYTPKLDANGEDTFYADISAGAVWQFEEEKTKVEWWTYDPRGQELLLTQLREKKDELSTIGHSILAPEKAAPEAAETQMIRRAAENASLATFTASVSGHMERALRHWSAMVDPADAELTYSLNTDFVPGKMSAQEQVAWSTMREKEQISEDTFLLGLRDGGVVSSTLDIEAEKAALARERATQPVSQPRPTE